MQVMKRPSPLPLPGGAKEGEMAQLVSGSSSEYEYEH